MGKKINFVQLMESFKILQAVCKMNESCTGCWLYDPEEKETACLICKAGGNSLADNIAAARDKICLSDISLAPRKIRETNADMIRSMTDEELAGFLVSRESDACTHCEFYNSDINRCYLDNPCVKELAEMYLLDYLCRPVQESLPGKTGDIEN